MNQITRNAPFGTENTPAINVKIIGGKCVELVATPKTNSRDKSRNNREPLNAGPHGTPSMLTQPPFWEYEYADFRSDPKLKAVQNVTSYTSPNGDRTQSFRHGLPMLNKHPLVPHFGVSQPAGTFLSHKNEMNIAEVKDDLNSTSNLENNASIEFLIYRQMKGFPIEKIKDIYIELTGFDRHLSGYVSDTQLNLIALRYNLPIKLSLLKMITNKFADPKNSNLVDYESFLQFLSTCATSTVKTPEIPKMKPPYTTNFNEDTVNPKNNFPSQLDFEGKDDTDCSSPLDQKLIGLISEQLSGENKLDVPAIKSTFAKLDRYGNGELKAEIIQNSCVENRLPLTQSVITKMLLRAEIANGIVNWRDFIKPLEIASHWIYNTRESQTRKESANTAQSSKEQASRTEEFAVKHESQDLFRSRNSEPPARTELWIRNFNKLSLALKSYHPYKSDLLPRKEVRRMVQNYNLIYGLGFSENQLSKAVVKAVTSNANTDIDQSVSVDKLLENLMDISTL